MCVGGDRSLNFTDEVFVTNFPIDRNNVVVASCIVIGQLAVPVTRDLSMRRTDGESSI